MNDISLLRRRSSLTVQALTRLAKKEHEVTCLENEIKSLGNTMHTITSVGEESGMQASLGHIDCLAIEASQVIIAQDKLVLDRAKKEIEQCNEAKCEYLKAEQEKLVHPSWWGASLRR